MHRCFNRKQWALKDISLHGKSLACWWAGKGYEDLEGMWTNHHSDVKNIRHHTQPTATCQSGKRHYFLIKMG